MKVYAEDLWHGFSNSSAYLQMTMVFGVKQRKTEVVPGIDPTQKWLAFFYSSVCIQITLTNLILEFKNQENVSP